MALTLKAAVVPALFVRLAGWLSRIDLPPNVSTNQLPATTNPRARISDPDRIEPPISCQPPEIRVASPRPAQSRPLVENSNVARQSSLLGPARSHVTVELSNVRLSVTASVLLSRARLVRACPARR